MPPATSALRRVIRRASNLGEILLKKGEGKLARGVSVQRGTVGRIEHEGKAASVVDPLAVREREVPAAQPLPQRFIEIIEGDRGAMVAHSLVHQPEQLMGE